MIECSYQLKASEIPMLQVGSNKDGNSVLYTDYFH